MSSSKSRNGETSPSSLITVHNQDVLLGRGTVLIRFQGNVQFRRLIQSHQSKYTRAKSRPRKTLIAEDIRKEVIRRKGRFLSNVDGTWVVANDAVVMEKIKQALRRKVGTGSISPKKSHQDATASVVAASRGAAHPTLGSFPADAKDSTIGMTAVNPAHPASHPVTLNYSLLSAEPLDSAIITSVYGAAALELAIATLRQRQEMEFLQQHHTQQLYQLLFATPMLSQSEIGSS